jgi:hypothetical protein
MAIEYMIGRGCPPKEKLGVEKLAACIRAKGQGEQLLALARETGDQRSASEMTVQSVTVRPDGERASSEVSVQSMIDLGRQLEPLTRHCQGCPACSNPGPFGCYGVINYPIPRAAEKWLMALLPDDLGCTAGAFLTAAVEDFEYDGGPLLEMRQGGDRFFSTSEPVLCSWGDEFELTSDQLLQMVFFVGALQPSHAFMLSLFLGLIPHELDLEALRDEDARRQAIAAAKVPDGDGSAEVEALRSFLRGMALAARLDAPLLVDA